MACKCARHGSGLERSSSRLPVGALWYTSRRIGGRKTLRNSVRAQGGPRRLSRSTPSVPSGPAESASRRGAGDAAACSLDGRKRKASVSWPAAATCRRRTWRASMRAPQPSTQPKAPLASACSSAHSAPLCRAGVMTASRARSTPNAASAGPLGRNGGATSSDQRPSARIRASVGIRRDNSPMPTSRLAVEVEEITESATASLRISHSAPRGQPPPGNSASSMAKPLASVGRAAEASWSAHQTSARARISSSETVAANAVAFLMWLSGRIA